MGSKIAGPERVKEHLLGCIDDLAARLSNCPLKQDADMAIALVKQITETASLYLNVTMESLNYASAANVDTHQPEAE